MSGRLIPVFFCILSNIFSLFATPLPPNFQKDLSEERVEHKAGLTDTKEEEGDKKTQNDLTERYVSFADLYYTGVHVKQDYKEAFKWLLKAAEQGDVNAQFNVSVLYYKGQGVPQDYEKAFEWRLKAAEQGDSEAQYLTGVIYESGEQGVAGGDQKALHWYKKAADQGHKDALSDYNRLEEMLAGGEVGCYATLLFLKFLVRSFLL